ncbi:hypothetical protein [Marinomonas spartinae]|uniref:hypothetical protein n=1 Tax=Marinomonas spartinae TaxID=1792290 RepID=UPI00111186F7|nr:hypothetical protein [Marinomonas spartinae]
MKCHTLSWSVTGFTSIFICAMLSISNQAYALDLVAFGRSCLNQEQALNADRKAIEATELERLRARQRQNSLPEDDYAQELADLENTLDACLETEPNSGYCHQVRMQYDELRYRAEKAREDNFTELNNTTLANNDSLYERELFIQKKERFEDLCRDSDAHYSLLNSPSAYQAVCGSATAKHSITCSFTD